MPSVIDILTVHYQTLDLLERLVKSAEQFYPGMRVIVVDGSNEEPFITEVRELSNQHPTMSVCQLGHNIGHGIGIVHGLKHVEKPYVFVMDSDDYFIGLGLFDRLMQEMKPDTYGVGRVYKLQRNMLNNITDRKMYYLHPSGMLLNMENVYKYKLPTDHGAPMIKPMQDIQDKGVDRTAIIDIGRELYTEYMCRTKRGTTGRWPKLLSEELRAITAKDGPCEML